MKESIVDGRIKKALESRTDSVTMLESLDAISDFFGKQGNTVESRRALRQDLEYQNIQLAKKFLVEFGGVRSEMSLVEADMDRVESECSRMATVVAAADENMKQFLQRAGQLEGRRNFLARQSEDISNFLLQFQLTKQEIDELQILSSEPTSVRTFLAAFKRLRRAYVDCKDMVEQHQYTAGFELLDVLGRYQDCGYQRLFEWVKEQCEINSSLSSESTDMNLQTAIMYLREVPTYYVQCQDLIVSCRRSLIVRQYVVAMSQDVEYKTGRVVSRSSEGHSNSTARYISNMLSWVHQAIASEEEFLSVLFFEATSSVRGARESDDGGKHDAVFVQDLLVRCLHGLGRPLKARITQVLSNLCDDSEVLYSIGDLLMLYDDIFMRLVPLSNSVQSAMQECIACCRKTFESALEKRAEWLRSSGNSTFAIDTAATPFFIECTQMLENILNVQRTSMSIQYKSDDECGCFAINHVISAIVHPLLQACRTCGNNTFPEKTDMAIFMVNNVCVLKVSCFYPDIFKSMLGVFFKCAVYTGACCKYIIYIDMG